MKLVMRKAISMDEDAISREEELISRLWAENKVSFLSIKTLYEMYVMDGP